MTDKIVLVFDVGTQSSRALLINNHGEILAKSQRKHQPPYVSPRPDWAERDADLYYKDISACSKELKDKYPELFSRVEAASLTTIRDTAVCVDADGRPLRPAILWLDRRMAAGSPEYTGPKKTLLKVARLEDMVRLQYQKGHCNWLMQNEPEVWDKTYKYLLLGGYLTYCLTGEMAEAAASIVGYVPFDNKARKWQGQDTLTRPIFNVPDSKLCKVVETGGVLGKISKQASEDTGLPEGMTLIATGSDKACEILGMGCITRDKAVIGLGTTATVTFDTDKYIEPEKHIPPYPSVIPGHFNPEIEIFRGYWLISWFKKEFAEKEVKQAAELGVSAEELLNKRLQEIPAGCEGLLLQPYFTPNVTMPAAKGAIVGFSDCHTRIHIYRAIIEGINFALMDGMKLMESSAKSKFSEIMLGGGGSQSSEICQITADMFGIPTVRTQTHEVAGIGSAIATFTALGDFNSFEQAVDAMVRVSDTFTPDAAQNEIYSKLYERVFKKIYSRMEDLYKEIGDIIG